jgi:membrane associated rhomboid family serine protease
MFPISDENPQILTPFVTLAIIAINVAVWVFVQGMGAEPALTGSLCRLALIPGDLLGTLPAGTRIELGPDTVCTLSGEGSWFTVLSSMFMHGGWMHIIGNMWFMWIFGNNVEDSMGHFRFIVFYLLCGAGAAAAQVLVDPASRVPMVGASGAIGGVMGAYIVLYPKVHVNMLLWLGFYVTTFAMPAMYMLGYWFLVQLISGVGTLSNAGGGVAFWAHVGGFVAGATLIFLFRDKRLLEQHPYHGWNQQRHATKSWHRVDRRR